MSPAALDGPLSIAAGPPAQPHPPPREEGLDFKRQPMTDWLRPRQLTTTGVKAMLAGLFGAYADKRELQVALHPPDSGSCYDADYSQEAGEFWFDYVADLGDGFNPTYSIAWLLSRPSLSLPGLKETLPRGRLLVLGGDQVYPTATRDEYQNRFHGPYEAAFPCLPAGARAPEMFALPGNHDWYDGLTSFTRLFCQERSIGGWKTRQRRSYFALRLPHNWWLWGADFQLDADIDLPQLKYFERVARQMWQDARAGGGRPRLILCTAKPSWVLGADGDKGCTNLAFFEERVVRANGLRLATVISGDLHHYTRYEEASASPAQADRGPSPLPPAFGRTQRITAGGGGAYLYPTHHLPRALEVKEGQGLVPYRRKAVFPSAASSRRLAPRCLLVPFRKPWFTGLLGSVYLLFAWMLQSASRSNNDLYAGLGAPSLLEFLAERRVSELARVAHAFFDVLKHSPSSVVLVALVLLGLTAYRTSEGPKARWFWGTLHGGLHVALGGGLMWLFSRLNFDVLRLGVDVPWWQFLLFSAEMLAVGGVLGGVLFTLYLLLSSTLTSCHTNDVYSSQAIEGFKNFLRLRIDGDGRLTLYPVGIEDVPGTGDWQYRPQARPGDPWFDPPSGALRPELIEGPVRTL